MVGIEFWTDRDALAEGAALMVAQALSRPGAVSFAATGGSTPGATYRRLSAMDIGWNRVTVTLTDDRWVDPTAAESNERLVREQLLVGPAAAARFLPLKGNGSTPESDARSAEPSLAALRPFDVVLLGMGEDGHIASLFPDHPAPAPRRLCVGVPMSGLAPYLPRVTLTLGALLNARLIVVQVCGEAKRALIERVLATPGFEPPIAGVLRQDRTPVRVLWSL